jgi:DnaJ-class molecular chaperone
MQIPQTPVSGKSVSRYAYSSRLENIMPNEKGPNIKKKQKCKNCDGKGTVKKGDREMKCQRCGGTGVR